MIRTRIGSCDCPRCEHCGGPPGLCCCDEYDEGYGDYCTDPDCGCGDAGVAGT